MRTLACLPAALVLLASSASTARDWDVRGHGQVVYQDGAAWKPIKGAHVKLMNSNTFVDDKLAEGWTDAAGGFDLRGRGGDTYLPFGICDDNCTKPDPYIVIELRNDRIEIETEIGFTWHANTGVRSNTAGDIDFGSFRFSSTDGGHAQILFGNTVQQYDSFQAATGARIPSHGGKINVLFPAVLAAGVPFTTEESIHWPGSETRWNAVFHEFGHRIRHAQDGDFGHFLYDVARFTYMQQHWYDKQTNAGFAFNEGWAEYHSTQLDPSERYQFETWNVHGGDDIEGNVASKLMGLARKCGGFKNMWATLQTGNIHSYGEFEGRMKQKFPGCFKAPPAAPPKKPISVVKYTPIPLQSQQAFVARLASTAAARQPVRRDKVYLAPNARVALAMHQQHAVVVRLHQSRAKAHLASRSAALAAFSKHLASLKPITPEMAKSKEHLAQRQRARVGFIRDAFGPQLQQVERILAELRKERADGKNALLHKHLDYEIARLQKRQVELKQLLAAKPGPDLKIPVHLLPRALGAEVALARK